MNKRYAFGEVKAIGDSPNGNGEFEVILSMPTLDRDGEVIDVKAFEPLPASIPFHAFHNFSDPIGRAAPFYEGDKLKARGYYASTERAQEIRALVADGVIGHTSVGFMPPTREMKDGVPHIVKGELLEGSFVSVSSNREAAVLVSKAYREKPEEKAVKAIAGSWEERRDLLRDAIRAMNPDAWWTGIVATFDDTVVFELDTMDGTAQFQASYTITDGVVTLGASEEVAVTEVVTPKGVTQPAATDPEKAAAPAAASPADVPVGKAPLSNLALEAEAALVLLP
jgi:hypothetical protein